MEVHGAVALVTGASSGIGRAAAAELAGAGAAVIVHGRDRAATDAAAAAAAGTAIVADFTDPEEVDRCAREATAVHGRIDLLVNNAGFGWFGRFADIDPDEAVRIVEVNLTTAVRLTRALLPAMVERRRGYLVNVASIAGHVGVPCEAVYSATKAGLLAFAESLRYELAGTGVGVTVVSPGAVQTAFFQRRGRPYERAVPRPVPPERVARALVDAVRRDRAEVFVPRWMAFPAWLHGTWPRLYRRLASRFG